MRGFPGDILQVMAQMRGHQGIPMEISTAPKNGTNVPFFFEIYRYFLTFSQLFSTFEANMSYFEQENQVKCE